MTVKTTEPVSEVLVCVFPPPSHTTEEPASTLTVIVDSKKARAAAYCFAVSTTISTVFEGRPSRSAETLQVP